MRRVRELLARAAMRFVLREATRGNVPEELWRFWRHAWAVGGRDAIALRVVVRSPEDVGRAAAEVVN